MPKRRVAKKTVKRTTKRRSTRKPVRKYRRRQIATGFFSDLWDGVKSVAGPVNDILKGTKAISTFGNFIPGIGPEAAALARGIGYGKKKPEMPKPEIMPTGPRSGFQKFTDFLKRTGLISQLAGVGKNIATSYGLGRKKRTVKRTVKAKRGRPRKNGRGSEKNYVLGGAASSALRTAIYPSSGLAY